MRRLIAWIGLLVFWAGCGGGALTPAPEPADDTPEAPVTTNYRIPTDATSPLLVEAVTPDGQILSAWGDRDEGGVPSLVRFLDVEDGDDTTAFAFDENGYWKRITAPNGVVMDFEWLSDARAVLTATTPDGTQQLSTELDFANQNPGAQGSTFSTARVGPAVHPLSPNLHPRGRPSWFEVLPNGMTVDPGPRAASFALTQTGTVLIDVLVCGEPDTSGHASVRVIVKDLSNNEHVGAYPAHPVGGSTYRTTIPTGQRHIQRSEEVCQKIAAVVGALCPIVSTFGPGSVEYICLTIAAALVASPIPGDEAVFAAACLASGNAIRLYCSTLGQGIPGGPDAASVLCDAVFDDGDLGASTLRLTPVAAGLPSSSVGASLEVSAAGGGPWQLSVDQDISTTIRVLSLTPSSPAEGQSYVATVEVVCIPEGSSVRMSIIGTDEYTDSVLHTVTQTQRVGTFNLGVPGAAAGVRDVVTVEVTLPEGGTLTRTASLVFG